jgi:proteasome lid subunit RPN8/RPN11
MQKFITRIHNVVCMATPLTIHMPSNILDAIYAGAKELYPRESFLLLRGKKKKNVISITDILLAPFAVHGHGFAHFNPFMFDGDFSLVGTVHSHPSGNISPSHTDLNYFFGRILMIVGYPYNGKNCIAAYDSNGDRVSVEITDAIECKDDEFY